MLRVRDECHWFESDLGLLVGLCFRGAGKGRSILGRRGLASRIVSRLRV